MTTNLQAGDTFPDFKLPDHRKKPRRLSGFTKPSSMDEKLGFTDGYQLILIFGRSFFCPHDQQHMHQLVQFQSDLAVNFGKLATVSTDAPLVNAAFRAGLGAQRPSLSDEKRKLIECIVIFDETKGGYDYFAQPYTFVLRPDLIVHKITISTVNANPHALREWCAGHGAGGGTVSGVTGASVQTPCADSKAMGR